jgi:sterol desaturase/sphingolipid hydroxylase (fatty acid hydroxylase superfamily)
MLFDRLTHTYTKKRRTQYTYSVGKKKKRDAEINVYEKIPPRRRKKKGFYIFCFSLKK